MFDFLAKFYIDKGYSLTLKYFKKWVVCYM